MLDELPRHDFRGSATFVRLEDPCSPRRPWCAGPLQSPPKAPTARANAHVAVPYPPFAIAALVVALVDVPLIVSPALRIRAPAQPTAGMQTMLLSSLLPPSVLTQGSPAALLLSSPPPTSSKHQRMLSCRVRWRLPAAQHSLRCDPGSSPGRVESPPRGSFLFSLIVGTMQVRHTCVATAIACHVPRRVCCCSYCRLMHMHSQHSRVRAYAAICPLVAGAAGAAEKGHSRVRHFGGVSRTPWPLSLFLPRAGSSPPRSRARDFRCKSAVLAVTLSKNFPPPAAGGLLPPRPPAPREK